jgi:NAD(P)H-flavin reductase
MLELPDDGCAPLDEMTPLSATVAAKRSETADTVTLELELVRPLAFAPGQFTMLSAFGAGEVPISISGDPSHPERLVHTVRAVGLATEAICDAGVGEVLSVRGPFGRAWPLEEALGRNVVVVAGGVGLAPLRSAILALLSARERYGRLVLLYGGRAPDQLLYDDELGEWTARGLDVTVTVDSAGPEWLGRVGVVGRLVQSVLSDVPRQGAPDTLALLCGPEVMMRFTAAALATVNISADRVFVSMERNMQCGIGHCGHCQLGPTLVCRDGPVYRWSELERWLVIKEL